MSNPLINRKRTNITMKNYLGKRYFSPFSLTKQALHFGAH